MSLRTKIIVLLAAFAAVTATAAGLISYRVTRAQLYRSIDESLDAAAKLRQNAPVEGDNRPRPRLMRELQILFQNLDPAGEVIVDSDDVVLPVNDRERAVAASGKVAVRSWRIVAMDGDEFRMLTVGRKNGGALQVARSLEETQGSLTTIARRTLWIVSSVVLGAAVLGWLLGRQVTQRLGRLSHAAETVAATGDLSHPVPVEGNDEVSTLGNSFRTMLTSLAASRRAQHQLVQDAGHELRTPLTSLRTNISVLRRYDQLPAESRAQILGDLDSEARELTDLVNELVELATDRRDDEQPQPADLAALAERVAQRARRRSGREVPVVVRGDAAVRQLRVNAVERAIHNLVDNALKFAPSGPVEVTVDGSTVMVRDHGSGLTPGDEQKIFDRFYRSVAARSRPGSGLGLSIVANTVEAHGGEVFAHNAPDGGAVIGFRLP